jgi:hypothetical protein
MKGCSNAAFFLLNLALNNIKMAQITINKKTYELKLTLGTFRRLDENHGITITQVIDDLNLGKFGSLLRTCHEGIISGGADMFFEDFEESLGMADIPMLQKALTDALPNENKVEAIKPTPKKKK